MNRQSLSRGLSFFSVGLGLAELLAPRAVARTIGVDEKYATLLRLFGLREITSGLGIMQGKTGPWLWSRVGGDVMDLTFLGAVMNDAESNPTRVRGAMAAVVGVTLLDILASVEQTRNHVDPAWRVYRADRSGLRREPAGAGDAPDELLMPVGSNGGDPAEPHVEQEAND
jgi:hypothetical protein